MAEKQAPKTPLQKVQCQIDEVEKKLMAVEDELGAQPEMTVLKIAERMYRIHLSSSQFLHLMLCCHCQTAQCFLYMSY